MVGMSTLVGLKDNVASSPTHPPLYATLWWGDQSKSLQILIDSGADMSLMDVTLASKLGIPTQPLSIPMDVRALDGRSIGRVTHHTIPNNLRVSGNHSETIQFLLIESLQIPVVLGFSWLQRHNPSIDWSTGAIEPVLPCPLHEINSPSAVPPLLPRTLHIQYFLLFICLDLNPCLTTLCLLFVQVNQRFVSAPAFP